VLINIVKGKFGELNLTTAVWPPLCNDYFACLLWDFDTLSWRWCRYRVFLHSLP